MQRCEFWVRVSPTSYECGDETPAVYAPFGLNLYNSLGLSRKQRFLLKVLPNRHVFRPCLVAKSWKGAEQVDRAFALLR